MKRLSIKTKITLYVALVMALFAMLMMMFMVTFARTSAQHQLKETLREQVQVLYDSFSYTEVFVNVDPEPPFPAPDESAPPYEPLPPTEVSEFSDDILPPETDMGKIPGGGKPADSGKDKEIMFTLNVPENPVYETEGVKLYVYASPSKGNEEFIGGGLPDNIVFSTNCTIDKIVKNGNYYTYTRFLSNHDKADGGLWVMGAINTSISYSVAYGTLRFALLAIPFVIIFAAQLGYLITKRAFKPIAKITDTAKRIAGGTDLSERLNMGDGGDEISTLASTLDGMLDTIERNFVKEKQFTDDASHELRTPVAVIMAQSELALDPKATHEDRQDAIESINRQSHKMNKLLSELLTLARSDNKKEVLEKESFDLCELADMVIAEEEAVAAVKGISLSLSADEPVMINADRTQMMRVLINLINNAVKYGKEGGAVTVEVFKDEDGKAMCRVKDDGIGISEDNLPKIWNRFFRCDAARTTDHEGSMGLGLSMVKIIIESHGGTVWAESTLGDGSVFAFKL